jgi:ribose transport system ATP-binding protein
VFRNGSHVATFEAGTRSNAETIEMMIGRDIEHAFPPKPPARAATATGAPALETRGLTWNARLHDIDIAVWPGEIVGLGGLDGQGQSELFLALFGVLSGVGGEVLLSGKPVQVRDPRQAKSADFGIALVPEDRKTDGLMLPMSVNDNLSLAALDRLSRTGVLLAAEEAKAVAGIVRRLSIKVAETGDAVGTLSGGNQQKVVIGKWLINAPRILLLSDPTRGIDVGTKQEIYQLLRRLADEGAAIVFYSTDYDELIGCCDRVLVLYEGRIKQELAGAEITEQNLIASALDLPVGQVSPSTGVAR